MVKKIFILAIFILILFIIFFIIRFLPVTKPEGKTVSIYNWKEFTDLEIIKDFEHETGIKVILYEYETMPMMMSEVQSNPGKYDIIVVDGNIVSVMGELKLIEELEPEKIPYCKNVKKEMRAWYGNDRKYLVPYLWGTSGLVYNTKYVKENVDSWSVLWNKKYKGKIALMNDPREVMTVLLKVSGYSLNAKKTEELKIAEKKGLLLKENGVQFGETLGNIDKVIKGELWIAEVYNGDVFYKAANIKEIKFVNPKEGFNIWQDYMCLSSDAKNKESAYKFMNYFMKPEISARSTNRFSFCSPIEGAEKYINKSILANPIVYPVKDTFNKGELYVELGDTNREYERIFNLIKN